MSKEMQQCENGWNVDPMRCQRVNESGPSNAAVSNKGDRFYRALLARFVLAMATVAIVQLLQLANAMESGRVMFSIKWVQVFEMHFQVEKQSGQN